MAEYRGKTGGKRYKAAKKTYEKDESGVFETTNLTKLDVQGVLEVREDNRQAIANAIDKALMRGLEKVGLVAEGYAKRLCPVDTGRLRNSITHQINASEKSVYIGTNVEYAASVELGTYKDGKSNAQPFLAPAAQDHAAEYRAIIEGEMS